MATSKKNQLLILIRDGSSSWLVGNTLDLLLSIVTGLNEIDKKLEKLSGAPFKTAQRAFKLAKKHYLNEEFGSYREELERARLKFDDAADMSGTTEKIHALYLAGLCCDLLKYDTKKNSITKKP